ncbi:MAG: lytic transglycosylase [Acidimicrobiales bacterium]
MDAHLCSALPSLRRRPRRRLGGALARVAVGAATAAGATLLSVTPSGATTSTTVSPGDTLWSIAARYGTSVSALAAANGITDPNWIVAGQTLQVPGGSSTIVVTVSAGDDLSSIAARYGTTVSALAAANGITDPNLIDAGSQLTVTTGGGAPGAGAASPGQPAGGTPTASTSSVVTVQPGTDLFSIADAYHTTVALIAAANGLADPNLIEAGAQLVIPTSASAGSAEGASGSAAPSTSSGSAGAPTGSGPVVPGPPPGALAGYFAEWSSAYGVPLNLLEALTWWESGWNNQAVSSTGAIGLGQLEPATVDYIRTYVVGDQSLDPTVPGDNVEMTAAYLHSLLAATGGNESMALAAYYQGIGSLTGGELPSTRNYVAGVLAYAQIFDS